MIAPVPVRVECHCGYKSEEYPTAVHLEDGRREVTEILDRWYEGSADPGSTAADSSAAAYFKVRAAGGPLLILKHDPAAHAWYLMCEL